MFVFTLYMLPLRNIIRSHGIHFQCYADDTHLYLSMKPDKTEPLVKFQACLTDIKTLMSTHFLLLNSDKMEVIVFGPKHLRYGLADFMSVSIATVRNLKVIFDQDMSFKQHFNQVCKTAFFHHERSPRLGAEKLIHKFVTSRLD